MTRTAIALAVFAAISSSIAGAGCSKGDSTPAPPAPASVAQPAAPGGPAVPSASNAPSAQAATPDSAPAGPSTPPSASGAGPVATCGDKPLPPCPLAKWMKANASVAMTNQDFDALAQVLGKIAGFAPPGYANWVSISHDGADAARSQSLDGVKASCRGCHNQYKTRYRKEMRDRPI